jgi:hypothetical protein
MREAGAEVASSRRGREALVLGLRSLLPERAAALPALPSPLGYGEQDEREAAAWLQSMRVHEHEEYYELDVTTEAAASSELGQPGDAMRYDGHHHDDEGDDDDEFHDVGSIISMCGSSSSDAAVSVSLLNRQLSAQLTEDRKALAPSPA